MKFSVIIPTYKRVDDLKKCLDSLSMYFADNNEFQTEFSIEVLVTDDAFSTSTFNLVHQNYPWAIYLAGPGKGPAANRNNGAHHAKGDWLVFTDDDCLPQKGWLEAYFGNINVCNVLEGRTCALGKKTRADEECPVNESGGFLWSCNFAMKRKLFFEIGGFDEKFPYAAMEDMDLMERIKQADMKVQFVEEALVMHPWRLTKGSSFIEKRTQSLIYFHNKHPHLKPKSYFNYFTYRFMRHLVKATIPGLIKFHGRGIVAMLILDIHMAKMAMKSAFSKF